MLIDPTECYPIHTVLRSVHAERAAFRRLFRKYGRNLPTVSVIVVRRSRLGVLLSSRPCRDCLLFLSKSGYNIHTIFYSNEFGRMESERFTTMIDSPRTIITKGRLRQIRLRTNNNNVHRLAAYFG